MVEGVCQMKLWEGKPPSPRDDETRIVWNITRFVDRYIPGYVFFASPDYTPIDPPKDKCLTVVIDDQRTFIKIAELWWSISIDLPYLTIQLTNSVILHYSTGEQFNSSPLRGLTCLIDSYHGLLSVFLLSRAMGKLGGDQWLIRLGVACDNVRWGYGVIIFSSWINCIPQRWLISLPVS